MGSRRRLQPAAGAAGAFLCLGAGVAVIALGDADSETKRRISTRASKLRGEVLLKALSQRLHPTRLTEDGAGATSVPQAAAPTETSIHRFYVVTGPDAYLTSTARERWSHTLVGRGSIGVPGAHSTLHSERAAAAAADNTGSASTLSPWPAVRLGVPYDCALGTGLFSSLVDQQLVWPQHASPVDHGGHSIGGEPSSVRTATAVPQRGVEVERQHERQQSPYSSTVWDTTGGEVERDKEHDSLPATPPTTAARATPNPVVVSTWDSVVLWATQAVLDGEQLDTVALSALEQALACVPCTTSGETCPSPADASSTRSNDNNDDNPQDSQSPASNVSPSNTAASTANGRRSFLLDIGWSPSQELGEEKKAMVVAEQAAALEGGRTDGSEPGALLCVDLARWGWKLASRGLGTVMISSSNPWVLAELQQALQQALPESDGLSEENSEKSCDRQDSSGEVVVVRVALPSATQREQEVIAVARELELHHQLSVADVSMLAELTGGRRAGLLDILKRVKQSSSAVTIAEACRATVDGEALALAATWGLLPRDAASGAVGEADKSREEWSPLWEAMGMLSVPSVVVGVNAAGAASAASPPPGSAHPAQLLEECSVDGATLLRLTKEGWLELSPAAPPGSGTILEDLGPHSPLAGAEHDSPSSLPLHDGLHRSPPLTVHAAIVPLESLSRGVDRSFVGVPPLRLAAYRRLFDRRSSTALPETSPGAAKDAGHRRSEGAAVYVGIGDDGGGLQHVGEGSNGTSDSRAGSRPAFGGDFVGGGGIGAAVQGESTGDWNGVGLQRAGGNKELERAGCLIEAGVLGRQHSREEAKLSEDRGALSTNWAELGTVRGDLEKEGKNDDTSDGEWAEVQLELIRQERAVVARANEMRARRARLDTLRRDIIDLEKHARLTRPLPPGNSREHRQHQDKFLVPPQPVPQEAESVALMPSGCRAGVGDEEPSWAAEFVEEEVIRDAETGVRLMPLLPTKRDREQDGSYSSLMSASGAVGSSDGGGSGDGGDGPKRRGLYGFGKLWRWIRGSR